MVDAGVGKLTNVRLWPILLQKSVEGLLGS